MCFLVIFHSLSFASEIESRDEVTWGALQGIPINTAISGGGVLPEGRALTIYNASYRDKRSWREGEDFKPRTDATQVVNLLKLRYGVTDNWEISSVVPYVMMDPKGGSSLDTFGDVLLGTSYAFMLQRQGDPVSLSASAGLFLPTGEVGSDHLPGGGALGSRFALGLTKVFGAQRVDFDLIGQIPFNEGNRNYTKGESLSFNYKYAYLLSSRVDVGIEGTVDRVWNGRLNDRSVNNHSLEWFTGPTVNVALPEINGWVGLGAFFPVYRQYGQDTATEDCRVDFKIGILW